MEEYRVVVLDEMGYEEKLTTDRLDKKEAIDKALREQTKKELGKYIERKMLEREHILKRKGKIKSGRKLSRNYMAKEVLNVSGTWFSGVINGVNEPNDEMLLKVASFLEINEHEVFKVARRIHPTVMESFRKEYLGEFYLPKS